MIKTVLKHIIYEACIDVLFSSVANGFVRPMVKRPKTPCPFEGVEYYDPIGDLHMVFKVDEENTIQEVWIYDDEYDTWATTEDMSKLYEIFDIDGEEDDT